MKVLTRHRHHYDQYAVDEEDVSDNKDGAFIYRTLCKLNGIYKVYTLDQTDLMIHDHFIIQFLDNQNSFISIISHQTFTVVFYIQC